MKKQKVYKLRDKSTGLFSQGGTRPKFNKNGKIWTGVGHLRNHLAQYKHTGYRDKTNQLLENMNNWEIVEFELDEIEATDLFTFMSKGDAAEEYKLISSLEKD